MGELIAFAPGTTAHPRRTMAVGADILSPTTDLASPSLKRSVWHVRVFEEPTECRHLQFGDTWTTETPSPDFGVRHGWLGCRF